MKRKFCASPFRLLEPVQALGEESDDSGADLPVGGRLYGAGGDPAQSGVSADAGPLRLVGDSVGGYPGIYGQKRRHHHRGAAFPLPHRPNQDENAVPDVYPGAAGVRAGGGPVSFPPLFDAAGPVLHHEPPAAGAAVAPLGRRGAAGAGFGPLLPSCVPPN